MLFPLTAWTTGLNIQGLYVQPSQLGLELERGEFTAIVGTDAVGQAMLDEQISQPFQHML
ncbi:MAG: hypothetical protein PsegKO_33110 [Pseudohongiellaceae bacterium]